MPKKSGGWRHAIRSHLNSYELIKPQDMKDVKILERCEIRIRKVL